MTTPFSAEEVLKAIGKLKTHKAPGSTGITSECIKFGSPALHTAITDLMNGMWATGYTPEGWQLATTILIHKKGSKQEIGNYRPITLLNTLFKIWEKLLEMRLREYAENTGKISSLQLGSRKGKGTDMAINIPHV